jgi:hypothetical protein
MKKLLVWAIVLMICFGFTASAAAIEETVFGPMFIKKEKGKAKPVHYTFPTTIDDECNCTLFVQPFRGNKVKVAVVLNGVEVVSSGDKFVDGEIEVPVNLLETNEIAITVSGKPGAAVRAGVIVTRPAPTEITLGCATRGASGTGMIAGATVEVQFLDGTVLSETTGADGFCYFPDIPVGTVALVTASTTDGRMSSALAVFSESKDHVAIDLQMFPPGPGEVSGTIETLGEPLEGIVSILFSKTGYRAATIADASGAFSFKGLPLDGYSQALFN